MGTDIERCTECGAELTEGKCGNCAPTELPLDKAARRRAQLAAAREKSRWAAQLVNRKVHARGSKGLAG